jgi:prevent-host-death family protein
MKTLAAKEAKNRFGQLLDMAQAEPVTIEKKGRVVAVMLSREEYERLQALEDAYWLARAEEAAQEGFLSPAESEVLLQDLLRAEG